MRTNANIQDRKAYMKNYEISFLKFIFTIIVIYSHTTSFMDEGMETIRRNCGQSGYWAVHFFFIVSGYLMISHYFKNKPQFLAGKESWKFIERKFRSIAMQYYVAFFISLCIYLIVYIYTNDENTVSKLIQIVVGTIPEFFVVKQIGFNGSLMMNGATWYISAMLICMIPLYYMLVKNPDFFLYIFSPLGAFLIYGFLYNYESPILANSKFVCFTTGAIIRAFCGLLFGVCTYLVSEKIKEIIISSRQQKYITILEAAIYILIFYSLFTSDRTIKYCYTVMLLLPVAVAITFSGKSHIRDKFHCKLFYGLDSISLALYLNHWRPMKMTELMFSGGGYTYSVATMITLTLIQVCIYFGIIKAVKFIQKEMDDKSRDT